MGKRLVVIGLVGTTLDTGKGPARWERWRPTVSLCQHEDLVVSRLELLYPRPATNLVKTLAEDIASVSPETEVRAHLADVRDPWDFEEVYRGLHDFARGYPFDTDREEYLVHITTGTHVAQICLFLLTETRRFPAKLVQTGPPRRGKGGQAFGGAGGGVGEAELRIIDLDLSKYDSIAARFGTEQTENVAGLKSGIATRNAAFNRLIEELEHVAANSRDPILLTGPTGAGKSRLARRVYELKRARHQITGAFVEVNCATLRGDAAMSALFGHTKGAFTGAVSARPGLLRAADGGLLFLDEVGELGLDEQAMLLRALEEKRFLPMGSDKEATSDFLLIAGTNRDLSAGGAGRGDGGFREDLLARINLWTFALPALRDRREDVEPNLEYELEQYARRSGRSVRFNAEARARFLGFATSAGAAWSGNFRDLSAAVTRMATMAAGAGGSGGASGGRITEDIVRAEIARLERAWGASGVLAGRGDGGDDAELGALLGPARAAELDAFDRVQLAHVVRVCRGCDSMSGAGRVLFAASRRRKRSSNDADRLRKYLARFGLSWGEVVGSAGAAGR